LICLLPPLRMGAPGVTRPGEVWLPFVGWRPVGKELRQRLERFFSLPMIGIALLTLPLLAVEYFYEQEIKENPLLALLLQVGVSVIWVAFAFELVLMVSVAQRKGRFLLEHWIDVLIVVLPFVAFLPFLRLLRVGRVLALEEVARVGRAYRM